jgi:hypothetical protein
MKDCVKFTSVKYGQTTTLYVRNCTDILAKCVTTISGDYTTVKWFKGDDMHREGGPAFTQHKGEKLVVEEWFKDGQWHRDGGLPARTHYDSTTGQPTMVRWCENGKRHRLGDLPAVVHYKDGRPFHQEWCIDDLEHRIGGPARIIESNGQTHRIWFKNGQSYNPLTEIKAALAAIEADLAAIRF